jgi:hypothetical protein
MEVFRRILSHPSKVQEFFEQNNERLRESYTSLTSLLRHHGIPFLPAQAGFFLLLDLRCLLSKCEVRYERVGKRESEEGERRERDRK